MRLFLQLVEISRVGVTRMRRTNTFCRIEYLGHYQSRQSELSDIGYGDRGGVYSREREKIRKGQRSKLEKPWTCRRAWRVWGTSVAAFSLLGAFSIADVGIGIDLMLLVEKYFGEYVN